MNRRDLVANERINEQWNKGKYVRMMEERMTELTNNGTKERGKIL